MIAEIKTIPDTHEPGFKRMRLHILGVPITLQDLADVGKMEALCERINEKRKTDEEICREFNERQIQKFIENHPKEK